MISSYRPQIYNPIDGQMQRSPAGSFTETDGIVQPAIAQILTASTAIAPVASIVAISSASAIALTSAPTIGDGATGKFQQLILINAGANDITLQDSATLANSGLRLFKNTWTIRPGRSLTLIYRGDDWQQLFDGETLSDADILAAILRTGTNSAGINASTLQGLARSGFLQVGNNLSDLDDTSTARNNIGAGTAAWNAIKIRGYNISSDTPIAGQAMIFNGTQWGASAISSNNNALTEILHRDDNWGLSNEFQTNGTWIWRSRNPQILGNSSLGENAMGKIRVGYITLKNKLILTLMGGGSSNGQLKRVRILRASDNTILIDVGLNSLIGNTDTGTAIALDTADYIGQIVLVEVDDLDNNFGWAWAGIDLSRCYAAI